MIRIFDTGDVAPTGSDGSATGSATVGPVNGKVLGIYLDFHADQAATTDTTVATVHAPISTILTITDSKTDAWYYPRHQVHGATGTALTLDGTRLMVEPLVVRDYIKVSWAQANADDAVRAYIVVEE